MSRLRIRPVPVRTALLIRGLALALAAWGACVLASGAWAQTQADPERAGAPRKVEPVSAQHALAVTAHPLASEAALEILRQGGNAVDALIAAQFVLGVVEPQSSGIGGGGFLLLYRARERDVIALDGREEAPAAVTPEWFLRPDGTPEPFFPDRITGGKAVGVPGLVRMLEKASQLYGKLPLAQVLAPAIGLAENGFPVSPRLAESLAQQKARLARFPATRAIFFDAAGDTLAPRTRLIQKELAATLRLVAREGGAAFYRGAIARDIVSAVNGSPVRPGAMNLEDLAGYDAPLRAPVRGSYHGIELYGMGPPSSGAATLFELLNILEAHSAGNFAPRSFALAHAFVLAARLAYADREVYLADGDWVQVPLEGLIRKDYARALSENVFWLGPLEPVEAGHPPGADRSAYGVGECGESPSTTHLTVVDAERNVATATTTIEMAFGSGIVVPGRGFLLNNQLTDFSAEPADGLGSPVANRIEGGKRPRRTALDIPQSLGGKRPRSSMAPTLALRNGKPLLAIGSPGGPRIIQYVARTLLLTLDQNMSLQDAVSFPHLTHLNGVTAIEPAWDDPALGEALEGQGHQVQWMEQNSGLHGVWIDPRTGTLHAGVDPRREGMGVGY